MSEYDGRSDWKAQESLGALGEKYYFIVVKFGYTMLMAVCMMMKKEGGSSMHYALMLVAAAVCTSLTCMYETVSSRNKRWFWAAEAAAVGISMHFLGNEFIFLLPLVMSDTILAFQLPLYIQPVSLVGMIYAHDKFTYFMIGIFTMVIYCQHYGLILQYRRSVEKYEQQEMKLKTSIENSTLEFKNEMRRTNLHYENIMLQDKARLSQELHDKLGHRINGSVYQLEACRAIAAADPQRADEMLVRVTDSLREGMDEIRALLRQERPDGKRMALLGLNSLCEECRTQYGIEATLHIAGDSGRIDERVWNVIYDNCCEAVTNALKYSECSRIVIEMNVLNQILRCCVSDDGKGCGDIRDGMGLQGMKQRVGALGGTVDISGSGGFRINMLIPIEQQGDFDTWQSR